MSDERIAWESSSGSLGTGVHTEEGLRHWALPNWRDAPLKWADPDRVRADIDALRAITVPERPYTRRAFTPSYDEGRRWLTSAMAAAGLETAVDAAGNLVGTRCAATLPEAERSPCDDAPPRRSAQTVAIGSHIDTVSDGGAYDGIAGVVAGLEAARVLDDARISLPIALEVIDFLAEEPTDFGISCVGSRGLVGHLTGDDLQRRSPDGAYLRDAIRSVGGRPAELGAPLREASSLGAYFELHIEQGRVLERAGLSLGIVTGLVGIRRYEVRLAGVPGHSGTATMDERRDALAAAAEMVLAVEGLARDRAKNGYFVGTVGHIQNRPNGANVVPGAVTASVELRADTDSKLDEAQQVLAELVSDIADRRGIRASFMAVSKTLPVGMDGDLRATLARAARENGHETCDLPSGAGHDAGHVAALGPAAMIFIPCLNGISHSPEESASADHVAAGVDVLVRSVLALAEGM